MNDEIKKIFAAKAEARRQMQERAKERLQKAIEIENMKRSHDWEVFRSYGPSALNAGAGHANSLTQVLEHCKRCGLHYMIFKGKPRPCVIKEPDHTESE